MGRGRWHTLVGGEGVGGPAGQGSWTQSGLLHRGSNMEGDDPFDGEEAVEWRLLIVILLDMAGRAAGGG